jgi:hypothetical protein
MVRTSEAQDFHRQLLRAASKRLVDLGLAPIQHAPVEGGGRPDLAGRDSSGRFSVVAECLIREPTEKELRTLRAKYKGRKLMLVIPAGMHLPADHKYSDEVLRVVLRRKGKVVLPVKEIEGSEDRLDASVLEDLISPDPERFQRGLQSMIRPDKTDNDWT